MSFVYATGSDIVLNEIYPVLDYEVIRGHQKFVHPRNISVIPRLPQFLLFLTKDLISKFAVHRENFQLYSSLTCADEHHIARD